MNLLLSPSAPPSPKLHYLFLPALSYPSRPLPIPITAPPPVECAAYNWGGGGCIGSMRVS